MSQRSITLSLITLLAGAAAGAALMAGHDAPRPLPAATTALAAPAAAAPAAVAQLPAASAWRSVPEAYPAIGRATQADVHDESINSLGNLGDGP
jgi:hypothetical protein